MELGHVKDIVTSSATLPSGLYYVILVAAAPLIEESLSDVTKNEQLTFSCKGKPSMYYVESCRSNYKNGPNGLNKLLYHFCWGLPSSIFVLAALIRCWRSMYPSKDGRCKMHFHLVYFSSLLILFFVHLALAIPFGIKVSDVRMGANYNCKIGNSTFICVDSQVKEKSDMNIVCFSFTIILLIFVVVEFLWNYRKWRKENDVCLPECRKCNQFRKVFYNISDFSEETPLNPKKPEETKRYKEKYSEIINKYHFKHLTLTEFLSAVHVCREKNWKRIIKDNLKEKSYQVVVFSCQLIGGCKYDGMIKDMFIHDDQVNAIDVEKFLPSVLDLLGKYQQDPEQLFQLSIDIIVCFINKEVTTKKFIVETFNKVLWKMSPRKVVKLNTVSMRKVGEICERLIREFNCNEEELKETFEKVNVEWVCIDDVKSLTCVQYLPKVSGMDLNGMKTNLLFILSEVNAIANCEVLKIIKCELADDGKIDNMGMKNHGLKQLVINECKLNEISFINLYKLVLTSSFTVFQLFSMANIEHSWWEYLADAIAMEKKNEMLALKNLNIADCTQKMSENLQKKIVQCGVELIIDKERVELEIDSRTVNPSLPSNP